MFNPLFSINIEYFLSSFRQFMLDLYSICTIMNPVTEMKRRCTGYAKPY
jgi:hypothetical protein